MRISSCHFQLSTLFLQLANKFGKHDLFQGSHGIVFTRRVTLERLVATQACLWSKVKFCTRPEGWCSWVAKKGLGAKKVSFDTLPRPCIGRSVKVSLDSIAVSLFVNYETAMLSRSAYIHTFDVAMKIKQNDAKEISVYLKCSSHVHIPNVARIGNVSPCHSLLKDYYVEIAVLNWRDHVSMITSL